MTKMSAYSKKMVEAFINKPEKSVWYQNAFAKFNVNGVDIMKWHWSWWGFFFSAFFLLYRKQYLPALIVFILWFIPWLGLLVVILCGGYSTYFIYKGYKKKLVEIESIVEDEDKRIETMAEAGGYHTWVVWFAAISIGLYFVFALMGFFMFSDLMHHYGGY